MSDSPHRCLNGAAELRGRFRASCGQRDVPPHPTIRELAGDTWHELTGYDGRLAATFRSLVRPELLTRRYVEGQRARYLSPVRLYLIVSVVYFLVAAAAPNLDSADGQRSVGPGIRVGVTGAGDDGLVSAEERQELLESVDRVPWMVRPMLAAIAENPSQFRARLFTTMPRVFFALLPVFAAVVALFYRGHTFPTTLVFSTHVHAFAFAALTVGEVAKFSRSEILAMVAGLAGLIAVGIYAFKALRSVFGGGPLVIIAKMTGIGVLYMLASVPAFFIILMWAALT